jgi:hypothetical protein
MSTPTIDLSSMTAEQIKQLILNTPAVPVVEAAPETPAQPRDEQGRFIKAEESEPTVNESAEVQTESEPAAEPVVVEREIDLEDGGGIQVFRGVGATTEEAYAALADELVKAQANASKKIRELAAKPAPAAPQHTPEDEFLLGQRLLESPRAALREVLKEEFGLSPAEIKEKLAAADAIQRKQAEEQIAQQFLAETPDYFVTPANGARLDRQLALANLPRTVEGLKTAYNTLKADGLLVTKPAERTSQARSSGISTRTSPPPPPPAAEDITKLSKEELFKRAGGYVYTNRY